MPSLRREGAAYFYIEDLIERAGGIDLAGRAAGGGRGGGAGEVRAGAEDLHHGLGLRVAVDGDGAVEEEVAAVLVVGLHEVHQLHVRRVAPQLVAEDPRDQSDLVRGQRDRPRAADLRSREGEGRTRSMAVSPSWRTSISWTSSGRAVVAKEVSGAW